MAEMNSKFSWFSESFNTIKFVPTNHPGTRTIEFLPFVCSLEPTQ